MSGGCGGSGAFAFILSTTLALLLLVEGTRPPTGLDLGIDLGHVVVGALGDLSNAAELQGYATAADDTADDPKRDADHRVLRQNTQFANPPLPTSLVATDSTGRSELTQRHPRTEEAPHHAELGSRRIAVRAST